MKSRNARRCALKGEYCYEVALCGDSIRQLKKAQSAKHRNDIDSMLVELSENPYSKKHLFKRLSGPLKGLYSKRISFADRVLYRIDNNRRIVEILSLVGHYND